MAEYHVGCGLAGIYAGILNKKGDRWNSKSDVTNEAIEAVRDHFVLQMSGKKEFGFEWTRKDGKVVQLIARIKDKKTD